MHSMMHFDPFQSRLCRDIRNELSDSLMKAIQNRDSKPAQTVAEKYLSQGLAQFINSYINNRIMRYQAVITRILAADTGFDETYDITVFLWDQELFFETHDWLEKIWLKAQGDEKSILQALIRSAGTYVLLEQGREIGARKMASKAVATLTQHQESIPSFINIDLLIAKLKSLDPLPPRLDIRTP